MRLLGFLVALSVATAQTVVTRIRTSTADNGIFADQCRQQSATGQGPLNPCNGDAGMYLRRDATESSTLLIAAAPPTAGGAATVELVGSFPTGTTAVRLARSSGALDAGNDARARCTAPFPTSVSSTARTASQITLDLASGGGAAFWGTALEDRLYALCMSYDGTNWMYTGLKIKRVSVANDCTTTACTPVVAGVARVCCASTFGFGVDQCVNPNVGSCCGHAVMMPDTANDVNPKCCNTVLSSVVARQADMCDCRSGAGNEGNDCPNGESCCLNTKYTEMTTVATSGTCYRPDFYSCCDDGNVYDPGSAKCCPVEGTTPLDDRCRCDDDSDCEGPTMRCCVQTDPAVSSAFRCDKYTNFEATAVSAARLQANCPGQCIDSAYELCCNGQVAPGQVGRSAYQRCCNNTAYNLWDEDCVDGRDAGASIHDWRQFRELSVRKTATESLTLIRAFWVHVLPTALLFGSLALMSLVIIFANKASNRDYTGLELGVALLGFFVLIFSLPLYFSPAWKYGLVLVITGLFSMLTSAARILRFNAAVILVQLLALLYVFDPFTGNQVAGFSSYRQWTPAKTQPFPERRAAGVFQTIDYMQRDGFGFCEQYYDYFRFDATLRDTDRFDNPEVTHFGYCTRSWVFALLVFTGIAAVLLFLLFVLTNVLILLRRPAKETPVELQIVPDN